MRKVISVAVSVVVIVTMAVSVVVLPYFPTPFAFAVQGGGAPDSNQTNLATGATTLAQNTINSLTTAAGSVTSTVTTAVQSILNFINPASTFSGATASSQPGNQLDTVSGIQPQLVTIENVLEVHESDIILRDLNTNSNDAYTSTTIETGSCKSPMLGGLASCPNASYSAAATPIADQVFFPLTTSEAATIVNSSDNLIKSAAADGREYSPQIQIVSGETVAPTDWWLRSPGSEAGTVAYVDGTNGRIVTDGIAVTNDVLKAPRLSMFLKIPETGAENLVVGNCDSSDNACVKLFTALYQAGRLEDRWAKFDIIGINDGSNDPTGTCRLGTSATGASDLTLEAAYTGYTMPSSGKTTSDTQCPDGSLQVLMSQSYAFSPDALVLPTAADLAPATPADSSCVYAYANAMNSNATTSITCNTNSSFDIGNIFSRFRITKFGNFDMQLLQYDAVAAVKRNQSGSAEYHINKANYNSGVNQIDFMVAGGSIETSTVTVVSSTPTVCTVANGFGTDPNVEIAGVPFRTRFDLLAAGTCQVTITKAGTLNHQSEVVNTFNLTIHSVIYNPMAGTLTGSLNPRYFYNYTFASGAYSGISGLPSVTPVDSNEAFVGWCWNATEVNDDSCAYNAIYYPTYLDVGTVKPQTVRIGESKTPVAVIRTKRSFTFDYGVSPGGGITIQVCTTDLTLLGCQLSIPSNRTVVDGFSFDQYFSILSVSGNFHSFAAANGLDFLSWNTETNCGGTNYNFGSTPISADTAVYACWRVAAAPANCGFRFDDETLAIDLETGEQTELPENLTCEYNFASGRSIGMLTINANANITITEDIALTKDDTSGAYLRKGAHVILTNTTTEINLRFATNADIYYSLGMLGSPRWDGINVASGKLNLSIDSDKTVSVNSTSNSRAVIRVGPNRTIDIKGSGRLNAGVANRQANDQYSGSGIGGSGNESSGSIYISQAVNVYAYGPTSYDRADSHHTNGPGIGCAAVNCDIDLIDISTSGVVEAYGGANSNSYGQTGDAAAGIGAAGTRGGTHSGTIKIHGTGTIRAWGRAWNGAGNVAVSCGFQSSAGIGDGGSFSGDRVYNISIDIYESPTIFAYGGKQSTGTCSYQGESAAAIGLGSVNGGATTIGTNGYIHIYGGKVVARSGDGNSAAAIGARGKIAGNVINNIDNLDIRIKNANVATYGGNIMSNGLGTIPSIQIQPTAAKSPSIYPFPKNDDGQLLSPVYVPKTISTVNDTLDRFVRVPASQSGGLLSDDYTAPTVNLAAVNSNSAQSTDISAVLWLPAITKSSVNLDQYFGIQIQDGSDDTVLLDNLYTTVSLYDNDLAYPTYTAGMASNILKATPETSTECSFDISPAGIETEGIDYDCTATLLTIKTNSTLTVADSSDFTANPLLGHSLIVQNGITANLTVAASSKLSAAPNSIKTSGIDLQGTAELNLCLQNTADATISSSKRGAASLHVPSTAKFKLLGILDGCGTDELPPANLKLQPGLNYGGSPADDTTAADLVNLAAGIGANPYEGWGSITINGAIETTSFSTSAAIGGAGCWLKATATNLIGGNGCPDVAAGKISISGKAVVKQSAFDANQNIHMTAASIGGGANFSGKVQNSGQIDILPESTVVATSWEPDIAGENADYRFGGAPIGTGGYGGDGITNVNQVTASTDVLDGGSNIVSISGGLVMTKVYRRTNNIPATNRTAGLGTVANTNFVNLLDKLTVKITSGNVYPQNSEASKNMSVSPAPVGFYGELVYPAYLNRFTSRSGNRLAYCNNDEISGCNITSENAYYVDTINLTTFANTISFTQSLATPAYALPHADLFAVMWLPGEDTERGYSYSNANNYRFIYYASLSDLSTNFIGLSGSSRQFGIYHQRALYDDYRPDMSYNIIYTPILFRFKANNQFIGGTLDQGWQQIDNSAANGDTYVGQPVLLGKPMGLFESSLPVLSAKKNGYTFQGWYYEQANLLEAAEINGFTAKNASTCANLGMLKRITEDSIIEETNEAYYGRITFYGCWLDKTPPILPVLNQITVPNSSVNTVRFEIDTTEDTDNITPANELQYCIGINTNLVSVCGTTITSSSDEVSATSGKWYDNFTEAAMHFDWSSFGLGTFYTFTIFVRDLAGNWVSIKTEQTKLVGVVYNKGAATGSPALPASNYVLYPGTITISDATPALKAAAPAGTHFLTWCKTNYNCLPDDIHYPSTQFTANVGVNMLAQFKYNVVSPTMSVTSVDPLVLTVGALPTGATRYAVWDADYPDTISYVSTSSSSFILPTTLNDKVNLRIVRLYIGTVTMANQWTQPVKASDPKAFSAKVDATSPPAISGSHVPYTALTTNAFDVTITPSEGEVEDIKYTIDGTDPNCADGGTTQSYDDAFELSISSANSPIVVKAMSCDIGLPVDLPDGYDGDGQGLMTPSVIVSETFSLATYTIHFNANTSVTTPPNDETVYWNGTIATDISTFTPTPPNIGHTFMGWYSYPIGGAAQAPVNNATSCAGNQYYNDESTPTTFTVGIQSNTNLYACFLDKTPPNQGAFSAFNNPLNNNIRVNFTRGSDVGDVTANNQLLLTLKYAFEDCGANISDWEVTDGSCLGLTTFAENIANMASRDVNTLTNGLTYYFKVIASDLAGNKVAYPTSDPTAVYRISYNPGSAPVTGNVPASAYVISGGAYNAATDPFTKPAGVAFQWWCIGSDVEVIYICPDAAAHVASGATLGPITQNYTLTASYKLSDPTVTPANAANITTSSSPLITITHPYIYTTNIYYTLDGTDPTCSTSGTELLYSTAFNLTPPLAQGNSTRTVKTIVCDPNGQISPSAVVTRTYALQNYNVTFNLNSGTGTTPTAQSIPYGGSISRPIADGSNPTRAGYTFQGYWTVNLGANATNTVCSGTQWVQADGSVTPSRTVTGNVVLYACWLDKTPPNPVSTGFTPTTLTTGKVTTNISYATTTDVNNITAVANLQYKVVIATSADGVLNCATGTMLLNWTANKTSAISWTVANQVTGNNYISVCVRDQASNISTSTFTVNIWAKLTFDSNTGSGAPTGGATQYLDVSSGSANLTSANANYSGTKTGWTFSGWMQVPASPIDGWSTPKNTATTCAGTSTLGYSVAAITYPKSVSTDTAFTACWLDQTAPNQLPTAGFSPTTARMDAAPLTLTIPTTTDTVTPANELQYKIVKSASSSAPTGSGSATNIISNWAAHGGSTNFTVSYDVAQGLESGINYITVYARDNAGNISTQRTYEVNVGAYYTTAIALAQCGTNSTSGACTTATGANSWRVDNANGTQKVRLTVTVTGLPAGVQTLSGRGYITYTNRSTIYSGAVGYNDALACTTWTQVSTSNTFTCDIVLVQSLNQADSATALNYFFTGDSFDFAATNDSTTVTPGRISTKVIASTFGTKNGGDNNNTSDSSHIQLAVVPATCTLDNIDSADFDLAYLKGGTNCLFSDNGNGGGTITAAALSVTDTGQKYFAPTGSVTFKLNTPNSSDIALECIFNNSSSVTANYEISTTAAASPTGSESLQICQITPKLQVMAEPLMISNAFRIGGTWQLKNIIYQIASPADPVLGASTEIATGSSFTIDKVAPIITIDASNLAGLTPNSTIPTDSLEHSDKILLFIDLPSNIYSTAPVTTRICAILNNAVPIDDDACKTGSYTIQTAPSFDAQGPVAAAGELPELPLNWERRAYSLSLLEFGSLLPGDHNLYANILPDDLIATTTTTTTTTTIPKLSPIFYPYAKNTTTTINSAANMHKFQQCIGHPNSETYGTTGTYCDGISASSVTSDSQNNKFYVYFGPDESRGPQLDTIIGSIGESTPCTGTDVNCFDSKGKVQVSLYADTNLDGVLDASEISAGEYAGMNDCKDLPIWDDHFLDDGFGVAACSMPANISVGHYIIRIVLQMADTLSGTLGTNYGRSDERVASATYDQTFVVGNNPARIKWAGSASTGTFDENNAANYTAQVANIYTTSNAGVSNVDSTLATPITCGDYASTPIASTDVVYQTQAGANVTLNELLASPEGIGKLGLNADTGTIQSDGTFNSTPNGTPDIIETLNFEKGCRTLTGTLYSYSAFSNSDTLDFQTTGGVSDSPTAKIYVTNGSTVTDAGNTCGSTKSETCYSATFSLTLPHFRYSGAYTGFLRFIGSSSSEISDTIFAMNTATSRSKLLNSATYAKNQEATIPCTIASNAVTCSAHKNSYYLRSILDFTAPNVPVTGKAQFTISSCTGETEGQECNTTSPVENADTNFNGTYNFTSSYTTTDQAIGDRAGKAGTYTMSQRTNGGDGDAMGKLTPGIYQICSQYSETPPHAYVTSNTNCYQLTVVKAASTANFNNDSLTTTTATNPIDPVVTINIASETDPKLEINSGQVQWRICPSTADTSTYELANACTLSSLTGVTTSGTVTTATSASARTFTVPLGQIPYASSYKLVALFNNDVSIGDTYAVQNLTVTKVDARVWLNDCAPTSSATGTVTAGYTYTGNEQAYGTCNNSLLFNPDQLATGDKNKLAERGASGSSAYINSTAKIYMSAASTDITANLTNAVLKADSGSANNNANPVVKAPSAGKFVLNYYSADGTRVATTEHALESTDIVTGHQTMYGATDGVAKSSALYSFDVPTSISQTAGTYYVLGCFTGDTGYAFDCYNATGEEIPGTAFGANETTTGNFNFISVAIAKSYIDLGKMRAITINKTPHGTVTSKFVASAASSANCTNSSVTPTTLDTNQYLCVQVVTTKNPETTWAGGNLDNNAPGDLSVTLKNATTVLTTQTCTSWARISANTYACLITLSRASGTTFTSTTTPNALIDIAGTTVFTAIEDATNTLALSTNAAEYYLNTFSDSTNFSDCTSTLTIGCDALKVRVKVGSDLDASGNGETSNIWGTGNVTILIEQCDPDETDCGTGTDVDITDTVLSSDNPLELSSGTATFNLEDALSQFDFPAGKYRFSLVGYAGDTTFNAASGSGETALASQTVDFAPTTSHVEAKLTLGAVIDSSTDISSPETAITGQIVNVLATVYKYDADNTLYGGNICANMIDDADSDYQIVVKNSNNTTTYTSSVTNLTAVTLNCASTPDDSEYTVQIPLAQSAFPVADDYTVTLTWNGNDSYTTSDVTKTIAITKVQPGVSGHVSYLVVNAHNQLVTTTTSLNQAGDIIFKVPTGVSPVADNSTSPAKGYVQLHYFDTAIGQAWGADEMSGFNSANLAITAAMKADCLDPSGLDAGLDCYFLSEPMPKYINQIGNYVVHAQYFANDAVDDIDDSQADDIYGAFEVAPGATALSSDDPEEFDMLNEEEVSATVHLQSTEYAGLPNRCTDGSAVTEIAGDPPTYSCTTGTLIPAGVPDSTKGPTDITDGHLSWQIWATSTRPSEQEGESSELTLADMLRSGTISTADTGYTNTLLEATDILGEIATYTISLGTYVRPGTYVLRYAFCDDLALLDSHDETPDSGTTCDNSVYFEQEFRVTQPDTYIEVNFDANINGDYCLGDADCELGMANGSQLVTFYMPKGLVIGSYPAGPETPYEIPDLTVHDGFNFLGYTTHNPPLWAVEPLPEGSETECELDCEPDLGGETGGETADISNWENLLSELPDSDSITFYAQYREQVPSVEANKVQYIHEEYIYISGNNFAPNQDIEVGLSNGQAVDGEEAGVTFPFLSLTTLTTDSTGAFSLPFNVPASSVIPVGDYEIVVKDIRENPMANVSVNYGDGYAIEIVATLENVIVEDEVAFADGGADEDGYVNLTSNVQMSVPQMPEELLPIEMREQLVIRYELSHNQEISVANCDTSQEYNDEERPAMHLDKEHKWVQFSAIACLPNGARSVAITKTFELNTYTLAFEGNGGTLEAAGEGEPVPTMDSIEIAQGDQFALPLNAFTAPEYAPNFLGWAVSVETANADNPTIDYFDEANFIAPAADVTLYAIWKQLPAAPTSHINYFNEQICGLGAGVEYVVKFVGEGVPAVSGISPAGSKSASRTSLELDSDGEGQKWIVVANSTGCVDLEPEWFGQELVLTYEVVYGTTLNTVTLISFQQDLEVPQRPATPNAVVVVDEQGVDQNDGIIGNVTDKMEYAVSKFSPMTSPVQSPAVSKSSPRTSLGSNLDGELTELQWTPVPQGATQLTGLAPGIYQIRVAATQVEEVVSSDEPELSPTVSKSLPRTATSSSQVSKSSPRASLGSNLDGELAELQAPAEPQVSILSPRTSPVQAPTVSKSSPRTSLGSNSDGELAELDGQDVGAVAELDGQDVGAVAELDSTDTEYLTQSIADDKVLKDTVSQHELIGQVAELDAKQAIAVTPQAEYITTRGNFISQSQELTVAKYIAEPGPEDQGEGQTIAATGIHVLQLLLLLLLLIGVGVSILRRSIFVPNSV